MGHNKLNFVIAKEILHCFDRMCKQMDLIEYLKSDLKMPDELLTCLKNYYEIKRKLKYQMKKYPIEKVRNK